MGGRSTTVPLTKFQQQLLAILSQPGFVRAIVTRAGESTRVDWAHDRVLPLGALSWAAVGKDPGFTPLSLLELLKRQGRYRPEDFSRLDLREPFDMVAAKASWRAALEDAELFCRSRPPDELGCLYWSRSQRQFVMPQPDAAAHADVVPHYGTPGGVLPTTSSREN